MLTDDPDPAAPIKPRPLVAEAAEPDVALKG
jgi:hypothetical protein